jgi:hypothetical protein
MNAERKSKGHIKFWGNFELYEVNGQVFRALMSNSIDINGYRHGRWECSKGHFDQFSFLFEEVTND